MQTVAPIGQVARVGQVGQFDSTTGSGRVEGMKTMSPDGKWCSVGEAIDIAGCTEGLIRLRLREGRLQGYKVNARAWMVSVDGCKSLRDTLAPHSNVRKAEAAASAKPKARRKKSRA